MKRISQGFVFNTEDSILLVTYKSRNGLSKIYKTKNNRFFATFEAKDEEEEDELDYIPGGIMEIDEIIADFSSSEGELTIDFSKFEEG
jgi:hypothetical protein